MNEILGLALIHTVVIAAYQDLRLRKVPNWLTFGSLLLALPLRSLFLGWAGLGSGLLGWFVGLCLLLPFFLLKGIGAGDVKLLATIGAWGGPQFVLTAAIIGFLAGGIWSLFTLAGPRFGFPGGRSIPYAVPLGLGALFALAETWGYIVFW